MKFFFGGLFLLNLLPSTSEASLLEIPCGQYEVRAKAIHKNGQFSLVAYPESQSETTLSLIFSEGPKLAPYINRFVEAKVFIKKKTEGVTRAEVGKVEHIKPYFPNVLKSGKDTSFKLLKSFKCE